MIMADQVSRKKSCHSKASLVIHGQVYVILSKSDFIVLNSSDLDHISLGLFFDLDVL
jgi:hypothetical protein